MTEHDTPRKVTPADLAGRRTLATMMSEMSDGGDAFAVVMVDINHLAQLNDSAGRERGDDVMETVAEMLAEFAGDDFPLVHLGDDDFALLLPNTNRLKATIAGTRIQGKAVMAGLDTGDWQLLFNVGVASSDEGDPGAVLVKAEERLLREMARMNADKEEPVPLKADRKPL